MFENDYIKRLIKSFGDVIIATVAGKDAVDSNIKLDKQNTKISEEGLFEIMVNKYIREGKINEAESMIFEVIQTRKSNRYYEIALSFYSEINKWDEEKLTKCNFSKQEIIEGLESIKKIHEQQCN